MEEQILAARDNTVLAKLLSPESKKMDPISTQSIWVALQQMKDELISHFDAKIGQIQTSLTSIEGKLSTLGDKVEELEQRVSSNQDNITELEERVIKLEKDNAYLLEKMDEAENRSRASNLRFLHVPERSEGKDIKGFMEKLIPHLLGVENFPTPPVMEKIHRQPATRRQDSKAGPRPILVKFLNFQDKLKILRLAREKKELVYKGGRIHVYADYSAALLKKRRLFDPVKKTCQERNIEYSLLYPCRFRIKFDGKLVFFDSPADAESFLRDTPTQQVEMGSP